MAETAPYFEPSSTSRPSTMHVSLPSSSALEQAQQHLRDLRSEPITDLDTALLRLEEERRKYVQKYFIYASRVIAEIKYYFSN